MGICESSKEKEKEKEKIKIKTYPQEVIDNKNDIKNTSSNNDEENLNGAETHPSSNNQENELKKPELCRYERDNKKSEFSYKNGKIMSTISSQNEEEVIVRGEINKNVINKEADFVNKDLKNLVKKNGGIVINDNDKMSNVLSYQGLNPTLDIGKVSILSDFKSLNTNPIKPVKNENIIQNIMNNNNNNDNLRASTKINVSFHETAIRNDAFINIPKIDEPLPDADELLSNESPFLIRDSLISK